MKTQKNRPKSVPPCSSRSLTAQYRLPNPESLRNIQDSIRDTFRVQNCRWKQIKNLTSSLLDPQHSKRIDRLCRQYSILTKQKQKAALDQQVDVQSISRLFIKNKSKQIKQSKQKIQIRKAINATLNRTKKRLPRSFFQLNHANLNQMQKRVSQNKTQFLHKIHPYLTIYEESQTQALASLTENNRLVLGVGDEFPSIMEPQDWQKNHRSIKKIYTGIKTFRKTAVFPQQKLFDGEQMLNFVTN